MKHKRIIFTILLLLASCSALFADNTGGSSFSRYGFGDLRYFTSNRGFALGGSGIAILSTMSVDRVNPAAWGTLNRTKFSVGAIYEGYNMDDGYDQTYLSKTNFNGLILALPISFQDGISVTMGVTPFSKVNYNVIEPQSQGGIDYTVRYLGEGGVSVAHFGMSFKPLRTLYLGAKVNYNFGTISQTITQNFIGSSLSSTEVIRTTSLHGLGMSFGTTFSGVSDLLGLPPLTTLNFAAVVTTTSWLTLRDERVQSYSTSLLTPRDTILQPDSKIQIPWSLVAGVAFSTEDFLFAADYNYQSWSKVPVTSFNLTQLRNSQRIGGGVELLGKRDPLAPFSARMAYRIGGYYLASYYVLNGQPINEWGVTGGIGVPVWGETRFNLGVQYAWRGTTEYQLQKDKILRISFSINISEFWFNRPNDD